MLRIALAAGLLLLTALAALPTVSAIVCDNQPGAIHETSGATCQYAITMVYHTPPTVPGVVTLTYAYVCQVETIYLGSC